MHEEDFIRTVRQEAPLETEDAARDVTDATLDTLGERITDGEAADLARYVPDDLAPALDRPADEAAEDYSLDEFVGRVAQREVVEKEFARVHAHAVSSALDDAASERELDAARKQLPDPFGAVFEPPGEAENAE